MLLVLVLFVACGGTSLSDGGYAESPAAPMSKEASADLSADSEQAYGFDDTPFGERLEAESVEPSAGSKGAPPPPPYEQPTPDATQGKDEAKPLVVYTGFLKLQVRRLLETVDAITRATEARGGYIESLTTQVVVVRVPANDFESVMAEFAALGEVLDHSIRAEDITEQFTDIGARLAVAKEARARLMALLQKEHDVQQRLSILAEIKRLTEQIEAMESTLATLQNLVDYFTITIELVPVLEGSRAATYQSPFAWIRELSAHEGTLTDGKDDFTMDLPRGFVLFDQAEEFRAQSADTAMLRAAVLDNEPLADNAFWSSAVDHEMLARGEKRVQQGSSGQVAFNVYVNDDLKPRYYLVGVLTQEDRLFVIETFFPNQASYEKHGAEVVAKLATCRPD